MSPTFPFPTLPNSFSFHAALADVLAILGISPVYHQREVRKNSHSEAWAELLSRKKAGRPITVEDFDTILGSFAVFPLIVLP
jgi:Sulfotransferase domain